MKMNFKSYVIVFLLLGVLVSSCNKTSSESASDPSIQWMYSFENDIYKSALPAIDQDNNSYYALTVGNPNNGAVSSLNILSLSRLGQKRWKIDLSTTINAEDEQFIAYSDNRVFVLSVNKMFCINASSGELLWSKAIYRRYDINSMAVKDGKVYYCDKQLTPNRIIGFNAIDGSEILNLSANTISTNKAVEADLLAITGGILCAALNDKTNVVPLITRLLLYDIVNNTKVLYPVASFQYIKQLAVDGADNVIFILDHTPPSSEVGLGRFLVSLKMSGTINWKVNIDTDYSSNIYDYSLRIDENNDILIQKADNQNTIRKFSKVDGSVLNTSTFTNFNFNLTLTQGNTFWGMSNLDIAELGQFTKAEIGNGNAIYTKPVDFPYPLIDNNYTESEKRTENNFNFGIGVKVPDANGNIISVGNKGIYCANTTECKLIQSSWPKQFGNSGNTNSR